MLFDGLNAFWKTWKLFITGLQYSTVLARLFGDSSVPILTTLMFLSYIKLLHTIITIISEGKLTTYIPTVKHSSSGLLMVIWSMDTFVRIKNHAHMCY